MVGSIGLRESGQASHGRRGRCPAVEQWRAGITLIELLIVLGLLAAMASVALTSLDSMGDRTRMDTTRHRLDAIEEAIVGDGLAVGRFLTDMGRLPVDLSGTQNRELSELGEPGVPDDETTEGDAGEADDDYFKSKTLPLDLNSWTDAGDTWFNNALVIQDTTVRLEGGWRGPYLQVAGHNLYDGFGNPFDVVEVGTNNSLYDQLPESWIIAVGSRGRDNAADDDDEDAQWENADEVRTIVQSQVLSSLHVQILGRHRVMAQWRTGRITNRTLRMGVLFAPAEPPTATIPPFQQICITRTTFSFVSTQRITVVPPMVQRVTLTRHHSGIEKN